MKKFLTSRIFVAIITAIICITGTAYAASQILASDISYRDTTVEEALNQLYDRSDKYVALFTKHQRKNTTTYKLTNLYLNDNYGYIDENGDLIFTKSGEYKIIGTTSDGGTKAGGDVLLYAYLDDVLLNEGEGYNINNPNRVRPQIYSAMNNIYSYDILNQNVQINVNSKLSLSMTGEWEDNDGTMAATVIIIKL